MISHENLQTYPNLHQIHLGKDKSKSNSTFVQNLTGKVFISRLGERGLTFFKLLKCHDKFQWTEEAK
jgi:hypothetical protein